MSSLEKVKKTARERPKRFAVSVFLIGFWIAAPLVAQAFFDVSAITVSFTVTVIYFVAWKIYEHFY